MTGLSHSGQHPRATRPIGAERSRSKTDAGRQSSESTHRHRSSKVEQRDKYLSVERAPDGRRQCLRTVQRAAADRSVGVVDTPLLRASGSAYHEEPALVGPCPDCLKSYLAGMTHPPEHHRTRPGARSGHHPIRIDVSGRGRLAGGPPPRQRGRPSRASSQRTKIAWSFQNVVRWDTTQWPPRGVVLEVADVQISQSPIKVLFVA